MFYLLNDTLNFTQYPHVFEEPVVDNVKNWAMDESARFSGEDRHSKHDMSKKEASDSEMLKTYGTGLLAVCLAGYVLSLFIFPFICLICFTSFLFWF